MKSLLTSILAVAAFTASAISAEPKDTLAAYDKVGQALAADDLAGAKKAAADLQAKAGDSKAVAEHAAELAKSDTIKAAREHFKPISSEAIKLAQGQDGFFVMTCPMAKADWVQTSKPVRNPYYGKEMLECGGLKK